MAFSLNAVALPIPNEYKPDTTWVEARRQFLDGSVGEDVTASLRKFSLSWSYLTAAQVATLRTLFYKTSPLQFIDDLRGITSASNTYVWPYPSLTVQYVFASAVGTICSVKMDLIEHGTNYTGGATAITELAAGAGSTYVLTGAAGFTLSAPNSYTVTYSKDAIVHQMVNGTVWVDVRGVDTKGITRSWNLGWETLTHTQVADLRTCIGYKTVLTYASPTTVDAANAANTYVYLTTLPEQLTFATESVVQETAWLSPGTLADDASYGDIAWVNSSNAATSNDVYATYTCTSTELQSSHYLKATNFSVGLPSDAIIQGFAVRIERHSTLDNYFGEGSIKMVVAGSVVGTNGSTGTTIPLTDAVLEIGGSSSLWGRVWTRDEVNASTFGMAYAAMILAGVVGESVSVDALWIKVYYTLPYIVEGIDITLSEGIASGAAVPAIKVEIDLDGDGAYTSVPPATVISEDISAYVKGVTVNREGTAQTQGVSVVGGGVTTEATVQLRHAAGIFSPFNSASRAVANFYGKKCRISLGWAAAPATVFVGKIKSPGETIGAREATLYLNDLSLDLQNKRKSTALYQNYLTGTYLSTILGLAGLSSGSNEGNYATALATTGNYTLDYAWMDDESYVQEMEWVARAEGGRLYWDKTGVLQFEAADHLIGHAAGASAKTFTVANMSDLSIDWDYDNIYNHVICEYTTRYVAVSQVIWQSEETLAVPPRIEAAGVCAASSTTTVIRLITSGTYGVDALKGEWLKVTVTGIGDEYRLIKSNLATADPTAGQTRVTVDTAFSAAPATSDAFILGGIVETKAKFSNPAYAVITVVAWTKVLQDANGDYDYQALTGGGEDKTSSVSIAQTNYAGTSLLYLINSDTSWTVYMTKLQLRGQPLLPRETKRVERKDQTSMDTYGERILNLSGDDANLYIQNKIQAESVSELLLARLKDPHARLTISGIKGDETLEIGAKVTVTEASSSMDGAFGNTSTTWLINSLRSNAAPGQGFSQDLVLVNTDLLGTTSDSNIDWFKIGTSKYGSAGASDGVNHGHCWF